jgi:uncharacterized protein involved in exopolysaccharide biosynthesis
VRLGRESTALDPTAAASANRFVNVHASREYEINSVLELFNSRDVLSSVVSGVGPLVVLGKDDQPAAQTATFLPLGDIFAPYSIEDEALKHLANHLQVEPVKLSNVVSVSYEAVSPELARDVVTRLVDNARNAHIRVNRTDGSQEFFVTQAEHLRTRLMRLENELRDKKNAAGIAHLDEQRRLMLRQLADLRVGLLETEASLSASSAQLESHARLLERIPETITLNHTTGMPQTAVATMREQLFIAQVREKELLSRYTKHHPLAIAAADHIARLRAVLDGEPDEPLLSRGPNEAHRALHIEQLQEQSTVSSLRAQADTVRKQLSPLEHDVKAFNNAEAEFARLQREIEIETENYKRYAECLEQSRIDHELAMKNISNLNLLQPPTYSVTPTSPRPALNLAMGLVIALASSLGVGLFLEHRQTGLLYRLARPARDYTLVGGRFERGVRPEAWGGAAADPAETNGTGAEGHANGNGHAPSQ